MKDILARGNDPNAAYFKENYLHTACWRGYTPIVRLLLEYGAQVDGSGHYGGYTPLHVACRYGQVEIVEILLKAGADGSRIDGRGMAPLGYIEDIRDVKRSESAAVRNAIVEIFREYCPEALFETYCTRGMDR